MKIDPAAPATVVRVLKFMNPVQKSETLTLEMLPNEPSSAKCCGRQESVISTLSLTFLERLVDVFTVPQFVQTWKEVLSANVLPITIAKHAFSREEPDGELHGWPQQVVVDMSFATVAMQVLERKLEN